ncbi:hypothetical protein [Butyricimonas paravirosa]|uniref:hypothetical protein n=1 Tax=Butyricimonas paravirosa TaxID=1472417 RepID=UPI00210ACE4E|nr:hypothetical protein [Butyricimonas paravirosa]MCQ4873740.1 hypothetical protein [Butyricimonas paravirosa]
MAKFNSYLLGKVTRSVGNVTMCYVNKQNIAKAKIFARKDNPTPEILDQRARMKALVQLSRRLLPVIRKGFVGSGRGTTSNAFVKLNQVAVEVDEKHVATIMFDQMKVASGMLYPAKVAVTYEPENKMYSFKQEIEEEEDGYAFTDDKVYGVLFETVLSRAKIVTLRSRGESGSTIFNLPEDWDHANVKAYCFATLKNGSAASDSRFLTIE